jgi:hypothetical protein
MDIHPEPRRLFRSHTDKRIAGQHAALISFNNNKNSSHE